MNNQHKEHLTLEKVSRKKNVYKYMDVCSKLEYYIESPSLMPDVIFIIDGKLERPRPFVTLAWYLVLFTPILLCIHYIKIESITYGLFALLCVGLTVSLRTFVLCMCFQHSYNTTVILQNGGSHYERN